MRQNENLYLKTRRKCIVLFVVLLIKKIGIKAFIQDGLCMEELINMRGTYTWSKTSVKENEGLSARGGGGGGEKYSTQSSPI